MTVFKQQDSVLADASPTNIAQPGCISQQMEGTPAIRNTSVEEGAHVLNPGDSQVVTGKAS